MKAAAIPTRGPIIWRMHKTSSSSTVYRTEWWSRDRDLNSGMRIPAITDCSPPHGRSVIPACSGLFCSIIYLLCAIAGIPAKSNEVDQRTDRTLLTNTTSRSGHRVATAAQLEKLDPEHPLSDLGSCACGFEKRLTDLRASTRDLSGFAS